MIRINILLISPYFYPDIGGAENYIYNISKRIIGEDNQITVICSGEEDKVESINGINIIRLRSDFKISRTPIKVGLMLRISKIISSKKFDIMVINLSVPYFSEIAAFLSKIYKIPSILLYHNDITKEQGLMKLVTDIYNFSLIKPLLNSVDMVITSSPYCYNESDILKPYKDKTVLISPGVDLEKYKMGKSFKIYNKHEIPQSSKIILFVGVMSKSHAHKGLDQLITSFKSVLKNYEDSYLVLVGGGDMIPEYKNLCIRLNIDNKVIFTGFVDENEIIDYYSSSDIVVLPSVTVQEGFGMALIEGNACGKPAVGTRIGGIQYVIEEGATGLLVPPKDPEMLASAIIKLLKDETLSEKMGKNGREMVEIKYNWDNIVNETQKVYRKLL